MPLTGAHFQFNWDTEILIGSLEMLCCYFKILFCTLLFTVSSLVIKNSVLLFTGSQLDKVYLFPVAELNQTLYPNAKAGPAAFCLCQGLQLTAPCGSELMRFPCFAFIQVVLCAK